MDLLKILAEMHQERKRLKTIIASLVAMQSTEAKSRGPRVRKGMNAEARKAAAARMRNYWAARKQRESEAAK
jgi:hypothetical protein